MLVKESDIQPEDVPYLIAMALKQNDELSEKIKGIEGALAQAKKENQRLREQIHTANTQNCNLQGQLLEANGRIAELTKRQAASERTASSLQEQLQTVKTRIQSLAKCVLKQTSAPASQPQDRATSSTKGTPLAASPSSAAEKRRRPRLFTQTAARDTTVAETPDAHTTSASSVRRTDGKKTTTRTKIAASPTHLRTAARVTLTSVQRNAISRIAQAYNQLARLSGFDAREKREAFLKVYDVVPISCANDNERMSAPDTPPIFRTAPSALKAHAWAVPLGGSLYAVLPRSNITYDSTLHTADAMSEAFDSNYDAGAYNTIEVQSPALYQNVGDAWTIAKPGKLRLR